MDSTIGPVLENKRRASGQLFGGVNALESLGCDGEEHIAIKSLIVAECKREVSSVRCLLANIIDVRVAKVSEVVRRYNVIVVFRNLDTGLSNLVVVLLRAGLGSKADILSLAGIITIKRHGVVVGPSQVVT